MAPPTEPGSPLNLTLELVDGDSAAPIPGAGLRRSDVIHTLRPHGRALGA